MVGLTKCRTFIVEERVVCSKGLRCRGSVSEQSNSCIMSLIVQRGFAKLSYVVAEKTRKFHTIFSPFVFLKRLKF